MSVDDNYREVIRKAGKEITAGDNSDYRLQVDIDSSDITDGVNTSLGITSGAMSGADLKIMSVLCRINENMEKILFILEETSELKNE